MFQKKSDNNKLLLLLLLVACLTISAEGRPSADTESGKEGLESIKLLVDPSEYPGNLSPETILKVQQCEMDQDTMELCMRCAKITKSEIIYPMCCNNDDGVKLWCYDFVSYPNREDY